MDIFSLNFDILLAGTASSAIALMAIIVYLNNRSSITAQSFFAFAILTVAWSISNVIQYQFDSVETTLLVMRINLFVATWHALTFFQLSLVFPNDTVEYPRWYTRGLVPAVIGTSILTLTPLVFSGITKLAPVGEVTDPARGGGIILFVALTFGLLIGGVFLLWRKYTQASDPLQRRQVGSVYFGMTLTALLILYFSMIMPVVFGNVQFLPYSAFFLFPCIGLISYTIYKHHLFNLKVVLVQMFVFAIGMLTFVEVVATTDVPTLIFRAILLASIVVVGVMLTRSVEKEVEQREEIAKLSDEKSEFMTFASHEIRNPITAMRGYASLIVDGTAGDVSPQVKNSAEKILVLGNEVLSIISEFLNKSKFELGQMSFNKTVFNVSASVAAVAEGYKPHAEQKGLKMKIDIDPKEDLRISADETRLKEVVGNLIDNSLKYTPHGSITVSVHRHGVHARIVIQDTGVGIEPEVLPHLFKKFSRADKKKVNILGTGIGLYLAKNFIEATGGRVWAESDGHDKGSRFIIEYETVT